MLILLPRDNLLLDQPVAEYLLFDHPRMEHHPIYVLTSTSGLFHERLCDLYYKEPFTAPVVPNTLYRITTPSILASHPGALAYPKIPLAKFLPIN